MKFKSIPFLFLLLALLAASCSPVQTAAPAAGPAAGAPVSGGIPAACTVASQQPTPGPTERSHFPPPTEKDWTIGPADAQVTITEYGDYQ